MRSSHAAPAPPASPPPSSSPKHAGSSMPGRSALPDPFAPLGVKRLTEGTEKSLRATEREMRVIRGTVGLVVNCHAVLTQCSQCLLCALSEELLTLGLARISK